MGERLKLKLATSRKKNTYDNIYNEYIFLSFFFLNSISQIKLKNCLISCFLKVVIFFCWNISPSHIFVDFSSFFACNFIGDRFKSLFILKQVFHFILVCGVFSNELEFIPFSTFIEVFSSFSITFVQIGKFIVFFFSFSFHINFETTRQPDYLIAVGSLIPVISIYFCF